MIRHTWRYRYSRCSAPRIRSFHRSFPLSIEKLDQDSKLFNDNSTIKQTTITGKISSYLKGFIEQESRNIADALIHDDSMVTNLYFDETNKSFIKHYLLLEEDIRRQLDQTIDNYNKFCLLLTFNPISIHPVIYLRMYEKLDVPLEFDMRRLLAKRLTFHHLYKDCWKVLLDNDTTLNDIEDYVGIIVEELRRQNSFSFGIFEFLRSVHTITSNQNIKSTIIDTISYNYGIDKSHISQYISLTDEFENIQGLDEITAFYELQIQNQSYDEPIKRLIELIYMKRKAVLYSYLASENKTLTDRQFFFVELLALKDLINTPGWLTAVMPRIPSFSYLSNPSESMRNKDLQDNERISYFIVKFMKSSNKLTLSDYDILHVLKDLKPSELRTFFRFYKKLHKHNLRATNTHINNHLFHLALITQDTQILFEILAYFHNTIQTDRIGKALSLIFDDSKSNFKLLVKKLNKRKSEEKNLKTFEHFLDDLIKNNENNLPKFQAFAQSINRTKIMNHIMRKLLHNISINNMSKNEAIDFFNSMILEFKNSTTVLLEISRCAIVRNRILDAELISLLFGKILGRSLFFSKQSNIPYSFEMKIHNDFQKSYALASYQDKAKLHNSIRAFAQCISNLNVDEIVVVMNILNQAIFKDNFELIQSNLGRHYIFSNLTFDVMRFVYRSQIKSGSNGILKIAEIIKGFNFKSEIAQGFLYKSMVSKDSKQALNIFNHHMKNDGYVRRSLLRYILSGIFSSTRHSDKEKIELFYEFKSSLAKSGYDLKLQTVNVIELMNIIVKITKDSPNKSIQSIQTILNYADQHNIPPSVMRYWIDKLK